MKKLIVIFLLLPSIAMAQKGPCRKISKTIDDKTATISFRSPRLQHITAIREFKMTEFFGLHIYLKYEHDLLNTKGISITLSDGTVYKEDGATVDCKQIPVNFDNRYATGSEGYQLQGFIHITAGNLEKLTSRRITKVQLNEASAIISEKEGNKIKAFIICLADAKP